MRLVTAMRGVARGALRRGLACVFALRARWRGVPWGGAGVGARERACRILVGASCACECANCMKHGPLGWLVLVCALPVRIARRGRADRGDARAAHAAARASWRGPIPFSLAMGC
jgi:hypothetical protein